MQNNEEFLTPSTSFPSNDQYRGESGKQTAIKAVRFLCGLKTGFRMLSPAERSNLATSFARRNKIVYGKAFDLVKCTRSIDFLNERELDANLNFVTVYEVKSTNRKNIKSNFSGYFFDLTTAELLVAQSLGTQFKFAFVNTFEHKYQELTLTELYARVKGIYPKWAIRF